MLIIGTSQVINILISIVRIKVLAVLLGPSGVGLLSVYNGLLEVVEKTAALGMQSSGLREIATSRGDEARLSRVRQVLFAAYLIQGVLAMIAVWLLRDHITIWLFGEATRTTEVGLIGVAILIGLLSYAQTTLLQGLRKISELGRVNVFSNCVGTLAGVAAVWLQGENGLIWFILVQPLAIVLIALHYTRRLTKPTSVRLSLFKTWNVWKPMAKLGVAFMLGGLATVATLLIIRAHISQELGLDAAGHFAAAWGITMTYVGFILVAMGAEYYPRLTEMINDKVAAVQLMNDQTQLGLAISGPIFLLLIGLAPWVITLLYSEKFDPAIPLLQWLMVGNVFKFVGSVLGFSIVASGRAKTFLFVELSFNIVFLGMVFVFMPHVGLEATAYAFVFGYLLHMCMVYLVARQTLSFRWQSFSLSLLALHTSLGVALLILALIAPLAAAIASPLLATATGLYGLRIVLRKVGKYGRLPTRLYGIFVRLGWPIQSAV
jgi:O-antigen/teichoic acid export membrane protein